jgi:hypothetical protein
MQLSAQLRTSRSVPPGTRLRPGFPGARVDLPKLLRWLGGALLISVLTLVAFAQSSVTLAWDPVADDTVAGYRLYEGVVSRTYTNSIDVRNVTTATVSNLAWGTTYYFAITAYDTNGQESAFSDEISFAVPFPTNTDLTFSTDSGTFTEPFAAHNGALSQPLRTGVADGGRVVYSFNITNAGDYLVVAAVIAPSLSENTFYVNIDAEPTDPLMIWDIPVCSSLTKRTVSWRINNGDSTLDQYPPKVFTLGVGPHQLIIRGRDANTAVGQISIVPLPPGPMLSIFLSTAETDPAEPTQPAQPTMVLSIAGPPGQSYSVLGSEDLQTWTILGSVTLDASGSAQFSDSDGISHPARMYRLQQAPPGPTLSISLERAGTGLGKSTQPAQIAVVLTIAGTPGRSYDVLRSNDLKAWTVLGPITLDGSGSAQFRDLDGVASSAGTYRLRQVKAR